MKYNLKSFGVVLFIYTLVAMYNQRLVFANRMCQPGDPEYLEALWKEKVSKTCPDQTMMMLPIVLKMSRIKGEVMDGPECKHETGCKLKNMNCADCSAPKLYSTRLPSDSPGNTYDSSSLSNMTEELSECPWHYQTQADKFRYPKSLVSAKCNCENCQVTAGIEYGCEPIEYNLPVLYAIKRKYGLGETCDYDITYQAVSTGCTCARRPKGSQPIDNKLHKKAPTSKNTPKKKKNYSKKDPRKSIKYRCSLLKNLTVQEAKCCDIGNNKMRRKCFKKHF